MTPWAPKLFFMIYIAGDLGGTVGPLPYGYTECQRRIMEFRAEGLAKVVTPQGLTTKDVEFKCEYHLIRPRNAARWRDP